MSKYGNAGVSFLKDYGIPTATPIGANGELLTQLENLSARHRLLEKQFAEMVNEVTAYQLEAYHMPPGQRWEARQAYTRRIEELEEMVTQLTEEWLSIGFRH